MPYNQKTAIENQKLWLKQQIKEAKKNNHPAIEKRARETLASIERKEKAQRELDSKIAAFNRAWKAQHERKRK